jgi:hypothetical protein
MKKLDKKKVESIKKAIEGVNIKDLIEISGLAVCQPSCRDGCSTGSCMDTCKTGWK